LQSGGCSAVHGCGIEEGEYEVFPGQSLRTLLAPDSSVSFSALFTFTPVFFFT
jgi:hypothetical protein